MTRLNVPQWRLVNLLERHARFVASRPLPRMLSMAEAGPEDLAGLVEMELVDANQGGVPVVGLDVLLREEGLEGSSKESLACTQIRLNIDGLRWVYESPDNLVIHAIGENQTGAKGVRFGDLCRKVSITFEPALLLRFAELRLVRFTDPADRDLTPEDLERQVRRSGGAWTRSTDHHRVRLTTAGERIVAP